jgi:hypothetical protein
LERAVFERVEIEGWKYVGWLERWAQKRLDGVADKR